MKSSLQSHLGRVIISFCQSIVWATLFVQAWLNVAPSVGKMASSVAVLLALLLCQITILIIHIQNIWNASLDENNPLFKIYNWIYFSCAFIKIVYKIIWLDMRFILFTIFFGTIVKDVLDISRFKTILGSNGMTPLVGPWEIPLFLYHVGSCTVNILAVIILR